MEVLFRLLDALTFVIIGDAVLSWVMTVDRFPRSLTNRIIGPLLFPFRKLVDGKTGGIDLSPMLAILAIEALKIVLRSI